MAERPAGPAAARAFRRWDKEGKKLRRTLEPVRNADVYLSRIGGLQDRSGASIAGEQHLSPRCKREIGKLEKRLKHLRRRGIDELMVKLYAHERRLSRLSMEMEAALESQGHYVIGSAAKAALKIFKGLALEVPCLDAVNLHSFRKRLKRALYLTEISAKSDPLARRQAASFRKIHSAVGRWHDWHSLAEEADHILPKHASRDGLASMFETLTEEALQKALALCRHSAAQVLKSPRPVQHFPPRKPVQNVSFEHRAGTNYSLVNCPSRPRNRA